MTQSKRPPVKPRPITYRPHAGQLAVVVSFRVADDHIHLAELETDVMAALHDTGYTVAGITIHVREIGAAGESSEMEGEGP